MDCLEIVFKASFINNGEAVHCRAVGFRMRPPLERAVERIAEAAPEKLAEQSRISPTFWRIADLFVMAIWSLVTAFTLLHHEKWSDEAQGWPAISICRRYGLRNCATREARACGIPSCGWPNGYFTFPTQAWAQLVCCALPQEWG